MDALLEHQAWVRALARRLVRDPHAAEDLAQEAYAIALERPSGSVHAMKAWLATVLRNLVRERARVDGSRSWREESTARQEATDSTAELFERVSAHRQVVETLTTLPEHYREVLLLRYFDGLTPTEIAEKTGVPLSTVKTRLARGLARMREELDRAAGGDGTAWLHGLAPLVAGPGAGVALPRAALAPLALRAVLVTLPFVLGGALLWRAVGGAEELPDEATTALALSPPEDDAPVAEGTTSGSAAKASALGERRAAAGVAPDAQAAPEPPRAPVDYPLRGSVQLPDGRAAAGVVLTFEPRSGRAATQVAISARDGAFEFAAARGAGRVRALGEGYVTLFGGEALAGRGPEDVRVVVAPGSPFAGQVVDVSGAPVAGAEVAILPPEALLASTRSAAENEALALRFVTTDAGGAYDLGVAIDVPGARLQVLAEGYRSHEVARPVGEQRALRIELARPIAREDDLVGRVETPSGAPAAGARVGIGGLVVHSNERGEFRVPRASPFARERTPKPISALLDGYGPATRELSQSELAAFGAESQGWAADLVLRLAPAPLSITGVLVDASGAPLPHVAVFLAEPTVFAFHGDFDGRFERSGDLEDDLRSRDLRYELLEDAAAGRGGLGLAWTRSRTGPDGRFEVHGLAERDYRLALFDAVMLRRVVSAPLAAGSTDVQLTLDAPKELARFAGVVVDGAGRPVEGALVVATANAFPIGLAGEPLLTTTRTGPSALTGADGRFTLGRLSAADTYLRISGADLVPRFAGREPEGWAGNDTGALRVAVERRLRLEVELLDAEEADGFALLDDEDERVPLLRRTPGRLVARERAALHEGRSDVHQVSARARTLVLFLGEEEVRRVPFEFSPQGVTRLRP